MRRRNLRKKKVTREIAFEGAKNKAEKNIAEVLKKYPKPEKLFEAVFGEKPKHHVEVKKINEPFPHISFRMDALDIVRLKKSPLIHEPDLMLSLGGMVIPSKNIKIPKLRNLVQIVTPFGEKFSSQKHEIEHIFQKRSRRWDAEKEFYRALDKYRRKKADLDAVVSCMQKYLHDEVGAGLARFSHDTRDMLEDNLSRLQEDAKLPKKKVDKLKSEMDEIIKSLAKAEAKGIDYGKLLEIQRKSTWKNLPDNLEKAIKAARKKK